MLVLLLLIYLFVLLTLAPTYDGTIVKADAKACGDLHLCSPSGYTYSLQNPALDTKSACDALVKAGRTNLFFYGDLEVRHLYFSMAMLLSGNYESVPLVPTHWNRTKIPPYCLQRAENEGMYQNRFVWEVCFTDYFKVCDYKVLLDLSRSHPPPSFCDNYKANAASVHIWGGRGGHSHSQLVGGGKKKTITSKMATLLSSTTNVTALIREYDTNDKYPCRRIRNATEPAHKSCPLIWVGPHQSYKVELRANRQVLHNETQAFVSSGKCGTRTKYVDTLAFTQELVESSAVSGELVNMTFDGIMWKRSVNLIKAQLLLQEVLKL